MDKEKLRIALANITKKYGKDSITVLGKSLDKYTIERFTSGIEDFDEMIGGGVPKGRIIELWGPNQAGKTTVAYQLCGQVPFAHFIDLEGTADEERAYLFGCKKGRLSISRPDNGEQACDEILEFTKAGVPLIVVDSIPGMVPKNVSEKEIGKDDISPIPRLMSKLFMRLMPSLGDSETTIVFINQVRDRIGGFGWGDPYTTPGGHAMKHYASLRIEVRRKGWIGKPADRFGQLIICRAVKSKVSKPYQTCELPLLFDVGFVKHEDLKSEIKRLRKDAKVKTKHERYIVEDEEPEEEN